MLQYRFSPAEIDGKPARHPDRVHAALRPQGRRPRRGAAGRRRRPRAAAARRRPRRRRRRGRGGRAPAREGDARPAHGRRGLGHRARRRRHRAAGRGRGHAPTRTAASRSRAQPGVGAARDRRPMRRTSPCIRDLDAGRSCAPPRRPRSTAWWPAGCGGHLRDHACARRRPAQAVTRYTLAQAGADHRARHVRRSAARRAEPAGRRAHAVRPRACWSSAASSPNDSGVFVEGHQVPLLYHFLGGPSVLTPRLIDRIDFYPATSACKYGRATAGIVDVGIKTDPTPRLHGQVDINFLDSSAYVEGPLGKGWSGSVSARRSYIDVLLPLVLPPSTTTAAPVYWDYQAGAHRELRQGGRRAVRASAATTRSRSSRRIRRRATSTSAPRSGSTRCSPSGRRRAAAGSTGSRRPTATTGCASAPAPSPSTRRRTSSRCATSLPRPSTPRLDAAGLGFDGELRFDTHLLQHPAGARDAALRRRPSP